MFENKWDHRAILELSIQHAKKGDNVRMFLSIYNAKYNDLYDELTQGTLANMLKRISKNLFRYPTMVASKEIKEGKFTLIEYLNEINKKEYEKYPDKIAIFSNLMNDTTTFEEAVKLRDAEIKKRKAEERAAIEPTDIIMKEEYDEEAEREKEERLATVNTNSLDIMYQIANMRKDNINESTLELYKNSHYLISMLSQSLMHRVEDEKKRIVKRDSRKKKNNAWTSELSKDLKRDIGTFLNSKSFENTEKMIAAYMINTNRIITNIKALEGVADNAETDQKQVETQIERYVRNGLIEITENKNSMASIIEKDKNE